MKILVLSFLAIIWIAVVEAQGETDNDLTNARNVNNAGKKILKVLDSIISMTNSDTFRTFGSILGPISPFLGGTGLFISIFQQSHTSPDMALMKEEFKHIDRQFGMVFNHLSKIETDIKEFLDIAYYKYEHRIFYLSVKIKLWLNSTINSSYRARYRQEFLEYYDKYYEASAEMLLHGMKRYVSGFNIPYRVMDMTKNHKRQTQIYMCRMYKLIIQGSRMELTYESLKQRNSFYQHKKEDRIRQLADLMNHIKDMSRVVGCRWYKELERNIDTALAENQGKSNAEFGRFLYNYLVDKFDERDWLVVTYDPVSGSDNHWVSYYGGYHRFRTHGRNLVVASVNDKTAKLDKTSTKALLNCVYTLKCCAKDIYRAQMPNIYPAQGIIKSFADVHIVGDENRTVVVKNVNFWLYAFK